MNDFYDLVFAKFLKEKRIEHITAKDNFGEFDTYLDIEENKLLCPEIVEGKFQEWILRNPTYLLNINYHAKA